MIYISDVVDAVLEIIPLPQKMAHEQTYIRCFGEMRGLLVPAIQSVHEQYDAIMPPQQTLLNVLYEAMQDPWLIYDGPSVEKLGREVVQVHVPPRLKGPHFVDEDSIVSKQKYLRRWMQYRSGSLQRQAKKQQSPNFKGYQL